jgi:hypothetical protein
MKRSSAHSLKCVTAQDVEPRAIQWLWPGWIPLGKLTSLEGDPGLGKSTLLCDLAARLSTGRPMPIAPPQPAERQEPLSFLETPAPTPPPRVQLPACGTAADIHPPADVIMLTAEDNHGDTVRPRLEEAGADLARVHLITGACDAADGLQRAPEIPLDLAPLEDAVRATKSQLLVIDPLSAYLGPEVNAYSDGDMRRCMNRLAGLAERTNCTVVLLRHLNKKPGGPALYRGGGSIGIIAAVRSALVMALDPDRLPPSADEPLHGVLAIQKGNLSAPAPAMRYTLRQTSRPSICRLEWTGQSTRTADELLRTRDPEELSALQKAVDWLRDFLGRGPEDASYCAMLAGCAGIANVTLRRAKEQLGVQSVRDGKRGAWTWQLPE